MKRTVILRSTGRPVVCFNCGMNHHVFYDDCDPGCDWDLLSGNGLAGIGRRRRRSDDWHPADDPRFLTSDRIGFSVMS